MVLSFDNCTLTGDGIFTLGTAHQRPGGTPPFGVSHRRDFHIRIDGTFHVRFFLGAVIVLVGLAQLAAGVAVWKCMSERCRMARIWCE